MRSFVISLREAVERRSRFFAAANQHGWRVEVFEAVDRTTLLMERAMSGEGWVSSSVDQSIRLKLTRGRTKVYELGPGHCACALSHMKVWEEIVRSGEKAAMVLEDDAVLLRAPDFPPWPDEADFIFFNNRVQALVPDEINDERALEVWTRKNPYPLMVPGCGLEAYVVTQNGARKALAIMQEMFWPVDLQLMCCARGAILTGHSLCREKQPAMPELLMHASVECYTDHVDCGVSYINGTGNADGPKRVQFGSGGVNIAGWVNFDLPEHDIRRPLKLADETVEYIFAEHVIEHVTPQEAWHFLSECRRVLQPGGVVRLAFPDLKRILHAPQLYHAFAKRGGWANGTPEGSVRGAIFAHGHLGAWTADSMLTVLEALGFRVSEHRPSGSQRKELCDLEQHWQTAGRAENDAETTVLEGEKPTT